MNKNKILVLSFIFVIIQFTGYSKKTQIPAIEKRLIKMGLVNVKKLDPSFIVDMKYSTTDNFMKKDAYGDFNSCYLYQAAAKKLIKAQKILKKLKPGYSLILYDCLRPRSVQWKMWELVKDTEERNYVANPKYGSIHNYGCAVDLSILNEKGEPLDMGTPFDFFGKLAQPRYEKKFYKEGKLKLKHLRNRQLLRKVMKLAGFQGIRSEWWHYNAFPKKVVKKRFKIVE